MDGLRGYPDESEPRWYEPERRYPEPEWNAGGDPRFGDGQDSRFGDGPDARFGDPPGEGRYAELADLGGPARYGEPRQSEPAPRAPEGPGFDSSPRSYAVGPRTESELPPVPPASDQPVQFHTQPIDRAALRRPPVPPGMPPASPGMPPAPPTMSPMLPPAASAESGGAVYRTRRVGVAILLIIVLVVFELVGLRSFLVAATVGKAAPSGIVSSALLLLGLPLSTIGLYGLATGAASPAALQGGLAWLRAPLAYLPVGLILLLGAAIAA
ncbi:MAG TPA: hypothetical protein VF054_07965 [Micromonosporaceae bacterium]